MHSGAEWKSPPVGDHARAAICPLTTDPTEIPLLRIRLEAGSRTGLSHASNVMVDKLTTMPRRKLGEQIGVVSDTDMLALSRALVVFLGLAIGVR